MGVEPEIYHLSGQDMVRYLGGEITAISRMYDHARKRLGLPQETITFNLVPFATFRFAVRSGQAEACQRLCEKLADGVDTIALRELVLEANDVLTDSHTQRYFTQHDCLATGDRIVVPSLVRTWPMKTCGAYLASIKTLL